MQHIRPTWIISLALAPLLAGCITRSGEAPGFPAPISETACPDLSGSFALQPDPGSQGGFGDATYTHELKAPATVFSLFDSGGYALTKVFHRDRAEFESAVASFRAQKPAEYARWRQKALELFDPMRGALKVRKELPFAELTRLGPVPEWGAHGGRGHCRDGWWVRDGDYDTDVALTRDVRGGLLVRREKTERKVIGLWAETQAGIPYSIHVHSTWSRHAQVEVPPFWTPTAQNLPIDDRVREAADPDGWLRRNEDPVITDLRIRTRKLMGRDAQLLNFHREQDYVLFTGTLPDRAALDALLVSLKAQPEVGNVKLENTMAMSFGRVRFVIHVRLRA
jgi:hypothetical protein